MATVTVGAIVKFPVPVPTAALKSFTAVGAGLPAGTVSGYETLLVGFVQDVLHDTDGAVWIVEAVFESECEPEMSVVDVTVMFQPAPLPLVSVTVSDNL